MARSHMLLLFCIFSAHCTGASGEQAEPALHKTGSDAILQWTLPPNTQASIVTVALQTPEDTQAVFYGSTEQSDLFKTDTKYTGRVEVLNGLSVYPGHVSFILKDVTAADAGRYVCIEGLANLPIIPDCGQMLVIVGTPENVTVVPDSTAVEHKDLNLQCTATSTSLPSDHNLPLHVEWFGSDGTMMTDSSDKVELQGSNLVIQSVQRQDLGLEFSCRASDGLDMWSDRSAPYTVVPQYGPTKTDIRMSRHRVEVNQGESLQEQCSATCNPACTVTWEKRYSQDQWYTVDAPNGLLDLTGIQRDNSGDFRCLVQNDHGSASLPFHVVVHYPPNLFVLHVNGQETEKFRVYEGANVTIQCQFDSSPAPSVRWYSKKDKDVILAQENLEDSEAIVTVENGISRSVYTSQYVLPNVQCSDTSTYVCTASNQLGSVSDGYAQLDVVCMPRNTHGDMSLKQVYLSPVNQQFFVKFQVEGYPQPEISLVISEDEAGHRRLEVKGDSWTVSTMTRSTHPYLTTFELTMPDPTPDFFDRTYYLQIENSEGKKILAFKLRERGPPKPPKNLTVTWTSDWGVHLYWIPGFYGGKPQTFQVQYQSADETDSDPYWTTVPTVLQETTEETPQDMTIEGLQPASAYNVRVVASNEYGNATSIVLAITTLAMAAASTDGGAIAGIVIAVLVVIAIIVLVLVYIFVIRPRRKKKEGTDDVTREPMLRSTHSKASDNMVVEEEKPINSPTTDNTNNNAEEDTSTEPLVTEKPAEEGPDDRPRNQDGLIYADLDLAKNQDPAKKPERKDAVDYEAIDFSKKAPPPPPADLDPTELASSEEELPSRK